MNRSIQEPKQLKSEYWGKRLILMKTLTEMHPSGEVFTKVESVLRCTQHKEEEAERITKILGSFNTEKEIIQALEKRRIQMTSLVIEKSKGGFRPYEPNKEEKQRLTIKANGNVWLTTYGLATEFKWEYKAMRKIRCRITTAQADAIINKAEKIINQIDIDYEGLTCDEVPDRLTIKSVNGVRTGEIMEEHSQALVDLYSEIRKMLPYENLLDFDYE